MWQRWWLVLLPVAALAGEWPVEMTAWQGATPTIDGVLSPGEWADAVTFAGVAGWTPQFTPTTDPADLALQGWVKHDGRDLFFAFLVTDDVLYGLDTRRWLPPQNADAHELSRRGYPWFGDENGVCCSTRRTSGAVTTSRTARATARSWQMVCNLTKSRLARRRRGRAHGRRAAERRTRLGHLPALDPGWRYGRRRQAWWRNPTVRRSGPAAQRGRGQLSRPPTAGAGST